MIGMELIKDPQTREPAKEFTAKMLHQGFQNGILLLSCGISTFRLMPPLMIDQATADEALVLLDKTFSDVEKAMNNE